VKNSIAAPEEGTSLHWHGILQRATPWFDGVPSGLFLTYFYIEKLLLSCQTVSQCPIAPNSTFTYSFIADSYGTSWYHSHFSAQYADGVLGAMVIYGPSHANYDYDLGPILLVSYKAENRFSRNHLTLPD
jgi:FtsP/CotA-like multicopper oxidase with cupredoxin domain